MQLRVVSGVHWCSKSSVVAKYSFCPVFYLAFCKWKLGPAGLFQWDLQNAIKGKTISLRYLICTFLKLTFVTSVTFRVVLRTGLWIPIASHYQAGRGDLNCTQNTRDRTNSYISVSTTLFHPRQTRKGAQCWNYRNCPLMTWHHLYLFANRLTHYFSLKL